MRDFTRTTYYHSLQPVLLVLAGVYSVLAVLHYFVLPPPAKGIMITVAASSAIVLILAYLAMKQFKTALASYTGAIAAFIIVGIPVFNTLAHIYLQPDAKQTTNLIIIILAAGILVLELRWFLFSTITALIGWALILAPQLGSDDLIHYSVALAMTFTGSLVVNINRKQILNNLVEVRKLQTKQNKELLETQGELKKTITDLTEAKEAAEAAAIAKEQFLSNMSHELRTPLNAVIGLAELLQLNDPREDQVDDLNTLQYSADNLLQLINDILDFSKINSGNMELEQAPFDPAELLGQLERIYRFQASDKNLQFSVIRQGDIPDLIVGDSLRLRQILHNLLSNALKFTAQGSIKLMVTGTRMPNNLVSLDFAIQDTGIGIPENKLQDIFEPFKQADGATTRKYGGTGLGLAITSELIKLHQTELHVQSTPGQGTIFSFSVQYPLANSETQNTSPLADELNLHGKHILAVDDNAINLGMITKLLSNMGATVDQALDGMQALEMIQDKKYHLVMMDVQMPGMDGLETTRRIRELDNPKLSNIQIIALTAASGNDLVPNIHAAGMNDYVFKPFKQEELVEKLRKALA